MTSLRKRTLVAAPLLALTVAACSTDYPWDDPPGAETEPVPTTEPSEATTEPAPTARPEPEENEEATEAPEEEEEQAALGAQGVSSGHPLASAAGMTILEDGGSAADAAIAAAFADAVLQPVSSGIGGGGVSMVVVDGETVSYDYREVVNTSGVIPDQASGTPGFVAGMQQLHEDHGELAWEELLTPAIDLADGGVPVSGFLAYSFTTPLGSQAVNGLPNFSRDDGSPLREGDQLVQPELAETMRQIAADPMALYTGALQDELLTVPGLDQQTLESYEVQVAEPVEGAFGDYTVLSAPPPLAGASIIQMLQIAEAAGIGELDPNSADFVDLQTQAWIIAEQTVQDHLADPNFADVPVEQFLDAERNAILAENLDGPMAAPAAAADQEGEDGDPNTTHISVVDDDGVAVSMTNTVTSYFGSGQYVAGFFVNDHLSRFAEVGVGGSQPEPGRRPVSWSAPSMVLDEQRRPVLVVGTPGGIHIPNFVASVVTRWALHDQELTEAVPADRFVHTGGELLLESGDFADELGAAGYAVRVVNEAQRDILGSVNAVEVDWEGRDMISVADDRRAAGFSIVSEADEEPRTGP